MPDARIGVIVSEPGALGPPGRLSGLSWVFARNFLLDLPRAAGARRFAGEVATRVPGAELVPFVWHLVSHRVDDPLPGRGRRKPAGDPAAFGALRDTPEVQRAFEACLTSVRAAGARRWLLATPASVTPGVGRARIAAFLAQSREVGMEPLWMPSGPWDVWGAREAAGDTTPILWTAGDDPSDLHALPPHVWPLIRSSRRSLRPAQVEDLASVALERPVIFGGPHACRHARAVLAFSG